ncbi:hypothetical protein [Mesobacillus zeae]|uniref:SHOCT domain-containing protein n=1 Tax=Mesobacillus zeae TaxID=1917180 RepID=A0A398B163_9BACI|nr:hypothetical protein [Mesobacillus zeae]RID83054.1 hypothetical protein D1970_16155 [Mesobacillus zeae]
MKKWGLVLPLTISLLIAIPGFANANISENALKMEELTVQVMPEFSYHPKDKNSDRPPLLVGYHGSLKNNTEKGQKGQIEIPLPMNEKNFRIGYVADYSRDLTEMNEIKYEVDKRKGTISWKTSEEIQPQEIYKFVIEYYSDTIKEKRDSKQLQYTFKSFADIGLMNLIFVEPLKSESFKLKPEAESHQKNTYNMNMFVYQTQGMKPGTVKNIQLDYKRNEKNTTAEILDSMAGTTGKKAPARENTERMPLWLVIAVVGGVSAAAALILAAIMKKRSTRGAKSIPDKAVRQDRNGLKKQKLRSMLLDGSITEEEYNELSKKFGG